MSRGHGPVVLSHSPARRRDASPRDVVDDTLYADGTRCTRHVDGTETWWTPVDRHDEEDA